MCSIVRVCARIRIPYPVSVSVSVSVSSRPACARAAPLAPCKVCVPRVKKSKSAAWRGSGSDGRYSNWIGEAGVQPLTLRVRA